MSVVWATRHVPFNLMGKVTVMMKAKLGLSDEVIDRLKDILTVMKLGVIECTTQDDVAASPMMQ